MEQELHTVCHIVSSDCHLHRCVHTLRACSIFLTFFSLIFIQLVLAARRQSGVCLQCLRTEGQHSLTECLLSTLRNICEYHGRATSCIKVYTEVPLEYQRFYHINIYQWVDF